MSLSGVDALRGGDAAHNAAVVLRLLEGEGGAVRDAVLLNAGAALAVYDAPAAPAAPRSPRGSSGPASRSTRAPRGPRSTAGSPRPPAEQDQSLRRGRLAVALEAEAVVVRGDHPRRGDHAANPCSRSSPLRRHTNSPGEVPVARGHVVELHPRDRLVGLHQHDPDRLVVLEDDERVSPLRSLVPPRSPAGTGGCRCRGPAGRAGGTRHPGRPRPP